MGRILRTAPGWLAAATDRQIVLCDLRRNSQRRLDLSLVELTHLVIRPDSFGLALVQERDRIGRVTASGRWIWKRELKSPVEELAVGPEGIAAVTTDNGQLLIFDPTGEPTVGATFDPGDPPLLIEAPDASPSGVVWVTLGRRQQQVIGHDLRGQVVWTRMLPWEGWSLAKIGRFAIVASADGRVRAFDRAGTVRWEGDASGTSNDVLLPRRGRRTGTDLQARGSPDLPTLDGRVRWRSRGRGGSGTLRRRYPGGGPPDGPVACVVQSVLDDFTLRGGFDMITPSA